jgi:hypothetical protein
MARPSSGRRIDHMQFAVGAHLARDPRHLRRERAQLIDHRVDRVLQLQHLAAHVDRDLARQVAIRDRGRDLGDAAHLARQVAGHRVDVVRQVLPRAATPRDLRLAAELAFGADLLARVTSDANDPSWSTMVLIVFFNSSNSGRTSTFFFEVALAAVVTVTMLFRSRPVTPRFRATPVRRVARRVVGADQE